MSRYRTSRVGGSNPCNVPPSLWRQRTAARLNGPAMTLSALESAASHTLQLAPAVLTERIGAGESCTPVRQTTLFAGAWGVLLTAVGVWAFGSSHLPAGVVAGAM